MPSSKGSADYGGTDSGDTAFIIICGSLVLLMALPGIVLFYGRWPPPSPFLLACGWPRDGGRTLGSDVAAAPRAALRERADWSRAWHSVHILFADARPAICDRCWWQSEGTLAWARAEAFARDLARPFASSRSASQRAKLVCVAPGRWAHRLQEMYVNLHSDLCRCQLDLHYLADVRVLACLWA